MQFDYPELIRVTTWDKNEISIQGSVSINGGESDDAFELVTSTSGNTISIRNEIKNMKSIPHRITIRMELKRLRLKAGRSLKNTRTEHGKNKFEMMSNGVDMEIFIGYQSTSKYGDTG